MTVARSAVVRTPLQRDADTVCGCGGLLLWRAGKWTHADACIECLGRLVCEGCDEAHIFCFTPEPVTCVHEADWACTEPVTVEDVCSRDRLGCCGCCNADYAHTREVY